MIRSAAVLACAVVAGLATSPVAAQTRVEAGVLECRGGQTTSFIVGSTHTFQCVFNPVAGRRQTYQGIARRVGLDIGITDRSVLVWSVLAPTRGLPPGALAGTYGGVSAGAAIGVGGGANVLVGGSNNSISLQPLSLEAQQGLNLAVGISGLELR